MPYVICKNIITYIYSWRTKKTIHPHTSKGEFSENFLKLFLDESISAEKAAETLDMTVEQFLAKAKVQMS